MGGTERSHFRRVIGGTERSQSVRRVLRGTERSEQKQKKNKGRRAAEESTKQKCEHYNGDIHKIEGRVDIPTVIPTNNCDI